MGDWAHFDAKGNVKTIFLKKKKNGCEHTQKEKNCPKCKPVIELRHDKFCTPENNSLLEFRAYRGKPATSYAGTQQLVSCSPGRPVYLCALLAALSSRASRSSTTTATRRPGRSWQPAWSRLTLRSRMTTGTCPQVCDMVCSNAPRGKKTS